MQAQALHIHRTPGRLRVWSPHLKQNPARALHARNCLAQLGGVRSVHLNTLTGSLLIHFDPTGSTPELLLEAVLASRTAPLTTGTAAITTTRPLASQATRKVAKVACAYAGEKLVEHLVTVLIAAVL